MTEVAEYVWSDAWTTAATSEKSLLLSGGADLVLEIEEVSTRAADALKNWTSGSKFVRPSVAEELELFDQLVFMGAVVPVTAMQTSDVTITWIGDEDDQLANRLGATAAHDRKSASRRLVIRTNGQWADALDAVQAINTPYLFVDAAYHHTLSIGPYAIPGETACAGCLGGRVRHRWEDTPVPLRPAVLDHTDVIAGLINMEIKNLDASRSACINAAVWWDFSSGRSERNPLLRVPHCPSCGDDVVTGRVQLPRVT